MKIGYIRVSKQEQNEALQRDALKEAGCEKYFSDKMTDQPLNAKAWRIPWRLSGQETPWWSGNLTV
ncbi:hypothetical protein KSC_005860 [Ktedonobacter sp. SOSP1-52]|nr:recombinase family protein [Ktedonobacter sp. SOSP1-52]GHO61694.1 hypothetical protein KSC_005860 [Ktedonobacter sp. SOSP1-52]